MSRLKVIIIYSGSILFFLFFAPGLVILAGRFLDHLFGWPCLPWRWLFYSVGAILVFAGLSFIRASWSNLRRIGRGHPQEAFGVPLLPPTQRVVIRGPYAYTRNPMVFGFLLHLLGIVLFFGSPSALLPLYPLVCALAVLYLKKVEEPHLIRRFGQEYLDYRERVSFLIPRVPE